MKDQPERHGNVSPEIPAPQRHRILLLVEGSGNRLQISRQLAAVHDLIEAEQDRLEDTEFDLAVVDGPGLKRWYGALQQAKERMEPVLLPVILILQRHMEQRRGDLRDIVDDFVVAPVDRAEFLKRVESLLRIRRYAVKQQQHLVFIANHDAVTGLPTRELLLAHLHTTIRHAAHADQEIHMIAVHVPMERFIKTLGHQAVDEIAGAVAGIVGTITSRWSQSHGMEYYLSRIATEQGVIVMPPHASLEEASHLCQALAATIHEPLVIQNQQVQLSVFFGISSYPADAEDASGLLKAALGALGAATISGMPQFYSREAQKQTLEFLRIEADLHRALDKNELELWFQPKFRLQDLALVGAEALIRWRLPSGELIPPGIFIPIAERSGLIQKIGRWVMANACETLGRWRRNGLCNCEFVAVNMTPGDLAVDGFVTWVKKLLETNDLAPSALRIELTETMLLDAGADIRQRLGDLRTHGVKIAIDDFGTGYSSLSYLQQLPADILKIDKSFVDPVPGDPGGEAIVSAIVALAGQFGLELVAEGIETRSQLEYLASLGVQDGQGYLVSPPLPETEFIEAAKKGLRIQ